MVKLLTHNINFKSSNLVTDSQKIKKIVKKVKILVSGSSARVKLMTHNPMFKGSNLVTEKDKNCEEVCNIVHCGY